MGRSCFYEDMATAPPFTQMTKNLYMGSRKALRASGANTSHAAFALYVDTAKEVRPPKSINGVCESIWIKLDDVPWNYQEDPDTIATLLDVSKDIARMVKKGHNTLIFCQMGMNRSGFITALVLMQLGWSLNAALKKIRQRHPCTISNNSFVRALRYIEKNYFGGL